MLHVSTKGLTQESSTAVEVFCCCRRCTRTSVRSIRPSGNALKTLTWRCAIKCPLSPLLSEQDIASVNWNPELTFLSSLLTFLACIALCVNAEACRSPQPSHMCSQKRAGRGYWSMQMQVEISLQPWRAFQPDGVILFSDILTPLTGMNIPFDISAGKGPIIHDPIRTMEVRNPGSSLCPSTQ